MNGVSSFWGYTGAFPLAVLILGALCVGAVVLARIYARHV